MSRGQETTRFWAIDWKTTALVVLCDSSLVHSEIILVRQGMQPHEQILSTSIWNVEFEPYFLLKGSEV